MTKIIKHTFCNHKECSLIGKEAIVTETIPATNEEKEWYWATVEGKQHKFQKGDLDKKN